LCCKCIVGTELRVLTPPRLGNNVLSYFFHVQNTAESENAVLTLRALVLCDKPYLKEKYEVRLKFHVE